MNFVPGPEVNMEEREDGNSHPEKTVAGMPFHILTPLSGLTAMKLLKLNAPIKMMY